MQDDNEDGTGEGEHGNRNGNTDDGVSACNGIAMDPINAVANDDEQDGRRGTLKALLLVLERDLCTATCPTSRPVGVD